MADRGGRGGEVVVSGFEHLRCEHGRSSARLLGRSGASRQRGVRVLRVQAEVRMELLVCEFL